MSDWTDAAVDVAAEIQAAFGTSALYRVGGSGAGVVVVAVFDRDTRRDPLGGIGVQGPAWRVTILQSVLPAVPARNDTIEIGTGSYAVTAAPEQDEDATVWHLALRHTGPREDTVVLALTILRNGDDIPVEAARIWNWAAGQNVAIGDSSTLSAVIDADQTRLVRVQSDVVMWLASGSSTPTAVQNGAGCIRLGPDRPEEMVVSPGHKIAAICAPGFAGHLSAVPAS